MKKALLFFLLVTTPALAQVSKPSGQMPTFDGIKGLRLGLPLDAQLPACKIREFETFGSGKAAVTIPTASGYLVTEKDETSDFCYHSGEAPELDNFIRILNTGFPERIEGSEWETWVRLDGIGAHNRVISIEVKLPRQYARHWFQEALPKEFGKPTTCTTERGTTGLGIPVSSLRCQWIRRWGVVDFSEMTEENINQSSVFIHIPKKERAK